MAFPVNSVLDDFNRDNNSSLGSAWTADPFGQTNPIAQIISGAAAPPGTGTGEQWWNATTFGPDCEAYITHTVAPDGEYSLSYRITNPGDATNARGYTTYHGSGSSNITLYRYEGGGTFTQSGTSVSQAIAAGDSVGVSVAGSTHQIWYKAAAGSWTSIKTITDSTFSSAGYIGFSTGVNTTKRFDNFGGGNSGVAQALSATVNTGSSLTASLTSGKSLGTAASSVALKTPSDEINALTTYGTSASQVAAAFAAANAAGRDLYFPAADYDYSAVITVDSIRVRGDGVSTVFVASDKAAMAFKLQGDGPELRDLKITCPTAEDPAALPNPNRLSTGESAAVFIQPSAIDFVVDRVTIDRAGSAGILNWGGSYGTITRCDVQNVLADGIHNTNGANNVEVAYNNVLNVGDDFYSVVSYKADGIKCHDIQMHDNVGNTQPWGRGVSVVGGHDIDIYSNSISNTYGAGILLAGGTDQYEVDSITVDTNVIRSPAQVIHDCNILVDGTEASFPVTNVSGTGNDIDGSKTAVTIQGTTSNISIGTSAGSGSAPLWPDPGPSSLVAPWVPIMEWGLVANESSPDIALASPAITLVTPATATAALDTTLGSPTLAVAIPCAAASNLVTALAAPVLNLSIPTLTSSSVLATVFGASLPASAVALSSSSVLDTSLGSVLLGFQKHFANTGPGDSMLVAFTLASASLTGPVYLTATSGPSFSLTSGDFPVTKPLAAAFSPALSLVAPLAGTVPLAAAVAPSFVLGTPTLSLLLRLVAEVSDLAMSLDVPVLYRTTALPSGQSSTLDTALSASELSRAVPIASVSDLVTSFSGQPDATNAPLLAAVALALDLASSEVGVAYDLPAATSSSVDLLLSPDLARAFGLSVSPELALAVVADLHNSRIDLRAILDLAVELDAGVLHHRGKTFDPLTKESLTLTPRTDDSLVFTPRT